MNLLIDSGSSKASVVVLDGKDKVIYDISLPGFNPLQHKNVNVATARHFIELPNELPLSSITEIIYGGAGCINDEVNQEVKCGLLSLFPNCTVKVCSDLDFIGHTLPIDKGDIIAILGTGSNAGVWDGSTISHNLPSGGYLLGDEGSGFALGKELIINYLRNNFSPDTQKKLEILIPLPKAGIIQHIYKSKHPNRTIASFVKHFDDINDELKDQIIFNELKSFIDKRIIPLKSPSKIIHIFGSIGYFNLSYLISLIEEVNLHIRIKEREPLDHFRQKI